ncbi:hypothetical protein [Priestia sp. P5]|uniref:hypothetical protein n=1 Tax=Priestia sp. P5 TaxID=2917806 RepID=UPI0024073C81|nr:hypothetical protein [Priestia sp. P5]MDG0062111.1 hypothetical protein [Priestia sp. P5]
MKVLNKLYPETSKKIEDFLNMAKEKKFSKEQAIRILISNPEFLDPVLFILFTMENNIVELSYKNYIVHMKNKGIQSKNKKLVLATEEALIIEEQIKL